MVRSIVRPVVAIGLALSLAACSSGSPPADLSPSAAPLPPPPEETPDLQEPGETPGIELTIVDPDALVEHNEVVANGDPFEAGAHVRPDGTIDLAWVGSPCELKPTLVLAKTGDDVAATLFRGAPAEGECVASEAHRTVAVAFREDVDAVRLEVKEGEPPLG